MHLLYAVLFGFASITMSDLDKKTVETIDKKTRIVYNKINLTLDTHRPMVIPIPRNA